MGSVRTSGMAAPCVMRARVPRRVRAILDLADDALIVEGDAHLGVLDVVFQIPVVPDSGIAAKPNAVRRRPEMVEYIGRVSCDLDVLLPGWVMESIADNANGKPKEAIQLLECVINVPTDSGPDAYSDALAPFFHNDGVLKSKQRRNLADLLLAIYSGNFTTVSSMMKEVPGYKRMRAHSLIHRRTCVRIGVLSEACARAMSGGCQVYAFACSSLRR